MKELLVECNEEWIGPCYNILTGVIDKLTDWLHTSGCQPHCLGEHFRYVSVHHLATLFLILLLLILFLAFFQLSQNICCCTVCVTHPIIRALKRYWLNKTNYKYIMCCCTTAGDPCIVLVTVRCSVFSVMAKFVSFLYVLFFSLLPR